MSTRSQLDQRGGGPILIFLVIGGLIKLYSISPGVFAAGILTILVVFGLAVGLYGAYPKWKARRTECPHGVRGGLEFGSCSNCLASAEKHKAAEQREVELQRVATEKRRAEEHRAAELRRVKAEQETLERQRQIDEEDREARARYWEELQRQRAEGNSTQTPLLRPRSPRTPQPAPAPPEPRQPTLTVGTEDEAAVAAFRQQQVRIRNPALAKQIKKLYRFRCQLCGESVPLSEGAMYAEVHHLKPLGAPHNGPDVIENMLCVCPNHHVQLDYGAIPLRIAELSIDPEHGGVDKFIAYHNAVVYAP